MPSVTRRNQVLKELERVQCEFGSYTRTRPRPEIRMPAEVAVILNDYPKLPDHIKRGLKDFFMVVPYFEDIPKPQYLDALNILRDQATLAQTEEEIGTIFEVVDTIRKQIVAWRDTHEEID